MSGGTRAYPAPGTVPLLVDRNLHPNLPDKMKHEGREEYSGPGGEVQYLGQVLVVVTAVVTAAVTTGY